MVTLDRLHTLLVNSGLVDWAAIDDAENYDGGTQLAEIEWLHNELTAEQQEGGVCARCGGLVFDPVIPQKQQEPVAWMYFDSDGDAIFGHPNGYRPDDAVPVYTAPQPAKTAEQEPVAWTPRELELIEGMIEVQLHHADQCDRIANRPMAEKQKGWDMERVALLRKIRDTAPQPRREVELTDEEIACALDAANVPELPDGYESVELEIARAVIEAYKAKQEKT